MKRINEFPTLISYHTISTAEYLVDFFFFFAFYVSFLKCVKRILKCKFQRSLKKLGD